jgi:hypothetical protein
LDYRAIQVAYTEMQSLAIKELVEENADLSFMGKVLKTEWIS